MNNIGLFLEANRIEQKTAKKEERRALRNKSNIYQLSDTAFKRNFRLNKAAFEYVLNEVKNKFPYPSRSDAVMVKHKLASTLRFLAEGSYQHGIGKDFEVPMAQSTFSTFFQEVLDILEEALCRKWISLAMSREEIERSKMHFLEKAGFPGVTFCVDGTHVNIIGPSQDKHLFYNRKGNFSLNVLIICDYKMRIRSVNANYQGANHDSHIWNISPQRQYFEQRYQNGARDAWLLGDAGYPLEPWLMTPFRVPIPNTPESRYNTAHKSGRNIVERTIGLLKSRFRCLLSARQLHYVPEKAAQIVNVCCALHNICIFYNADYEVIDNIENEDEETEAEEDNRMPTPQYQREAAAVRNQIVRMNFR